MEPTTLVTFLLKTHITIASVELLGSWDNFSKPYRMERDNRRGRGHWSGCYRFDDIMFDGNMKKLSEKRSGGLRMGGTYWYYYRLNGDDDFHNPDEPHTTACPLLPGQDVNILEVPIEAIDDTDSVPGYDISLSSMVHTLYPLDKFLAPRPAPLPPSRCSATPNVHAPRLKSPIPPLSSSSIGENAELENALFEPNNYGSFWYSWPYDVQHKSIHGNISSNFEALDPTSKVSVPRVRSCPDLLAYRSTYDCSTTEMSNSYRPHTSHEHVDHSPLTNTSSPTDIDYQSPLPELDDEDVDIIIQRPLTASGHDSNHVQSGLSRFSTWPRSLDSGRVSAARRERMLGLKTEDFRESNNGQALPDPESATTMLEDDSGVPYTFQLEHDEIHATLSPQIFDFNLQQPSPTVPQTAFDTSDLPVHTAEPSKAKLLQLERPGLLRSKFSEWSVTSADITSSPAPEVEDMQSPSLSAISYSSAGIITPCRPSDRDAQYIEEMMAAEADASAVGYDDRDDVDVRWTAHDQYVADRAEDRFGGNYMAPFDAEGYGEGNDPTPEEKEPVVIDLGLPDYFGTCHQGGFGARVNASSPRGGRGGVVLEDEGDAGRLADFVNEFGYLGLAMV